MGGDDLCSDDEYWIAHATAPEKSEKREVAANVIDETARGVIEDDKAKKRKVEVDQSGNCKKLKKPRSLKQEMLEMGRGIEHLAAEEQASFLSKLLIEFTLLSDNEKLPDDIIRPPNFQSSNNKQSLVERLKESIAITKLKKWKFIKSPCVIIVCISARRAVAILKELAPLNVRAAKLFPKNGSIIEQERQLLSAPYGIVVGTPHRLHALATSTGLNSSNGGKGDDFPLTLKNTKLLILDSDLSNKQFTVCTLPDTAPDCMRLLKEAVLPQLRRRKDLKLAFF